MDQTAPAIELSELSPEQQTVVRETLRSILDSPHFSKSKRYPALLEYVVLHALDRSAGSLKERSVGIDVFGRPPTYEPGTDPIVRVAAGEVRRRIAVYYSEHPEAPVRIDIPLGKYTAEFHFRPSAEDEAATEVVAVREPEKPETEAVGAQEPAVVEAHLASTHAGPRMRWPAVVAALAVAVLLTAGGTAFWHHTSPPPQRDFWGPVLSNSVPVLIVLGDASQTSGMQRWPQPSADWATTGTTNPGGTSMANAVTAAQMCNIFRGYGRSCDLIAATRADLSNLQNKTVIFIGRDNDWAHRILAPLRYRFQSGTVAASAYTGESIVDQADKTANPVIWKTTQREQTYMDYALVARFHSDITDGTAVVEAGLTSNGTLGTAQFLASPDNMKLLFAQAPKDWNGLNFEAVLQVDVVQGSPGHVKVVASKFW